jgi:hypothetical protein
MTTPLAAALDKLAPLHFPQITFFAARDVVKELTASSASETAIEKCVHGLSSAHQDILMKVLYVALSSDAKNSTVYLKWHGALYAAAGPGAIMRVLTDKPPMAPVE